MSFIFPKNPEFKSANNEKEIYEFLKKNMPNNSVTYYNYDIDGKQFDFCIAIEGLGVLIIEVKSWSEDYIVKVEDKFNVILKNRVDISPEVQARNYAEKLWDISRKKLDSDIKILYASWFTNLTEIDYIDLELNKVTNRNLCFFKDELQYRDKFIKKIEHIFRYADEVNNNKSFSNFTLDNFNKFRELFETKVTLENKNDLFLMRKIYSLLKIKKSLEDHDFERIYNLWKSGTKIYLILADRNSYDIFKNIIIQNMQRDGLDTLFNVKVDNDDSFLIYNFNIYYSEKEIIYDLEIIDGDNIKIEQNKERLKELDKNTLFNLGQYLIEHSNINKNICVKAGAGTGKTYTMISRIMFLIYKEKYTYEDIKTRIIMITFTRDAADSMKNKLKEEFMNYYKLTKDIKYIYFINSVTNMKISTIHSLILDVIEKYGFLLGYGNNIDITSGKIDRRLELDRQLNKIISKNEKLLSNIDVPIYKISKFFNELVEKIEGRNIDVINSNIDFGNIYIKNVIDTKFDETLKNIILDSQKVIRNKMESENKILLSQLIIVIKELYENDDFKKNIKEIKLDYIFIDEFQDTDNIQIDLVKKIRTLLNFKLFIVGDVKQCIYRFRGAEEDAFTRIIDNNIEEWQQYTLVKNYRTNLKLLKQFNKLFTKWGDNDFLEYNMETDELKSGTLKVNSSCLDIIDCDDDFERNFILSLKKIYEELVPESCKLNKIKKIGILVRNNNQVNNIMELYSKNRHEIPFNIESPNMGSLYSTKPIIDFYKLILALLYNKSPKYLYNLSYTSYINSKFNNWNLLKERLNKDMSDIDMYMEIMSQWPIKKWEEYLIKLRKDTTLMVLREIIYELKPWNNYGGNNRNKIEFYKNNLDYLFELMINDSNIDYLTLPKIEESLRIKITRNIDQEVRNNKTENNKISAICSTIHKSKGLEYDYVILPYTDLIIESDNPKSVIIVEDSDNNYKIGYKLDKYKNNYYLSYKDIEGKSQKKEEIRILYVALTRTKDKLVLFKYKEAKEESWQKNMDILYGCDENESI